MENRPIATETIPKERTHMEEFSEHLETSDSGLYTFSYIEGVGVQMLIDSGATCLLI